MEHALHRPSVEHDEHANMARREQRTWHDPAISDKTIARQRNLDRFIEICLLSIIIFVDYFLPDLALTQRRS